MAVTSTVWKVHCSTDHFLGKLSQFIENPQKLQNFFHLRCVYIYIYIYIYMLKLEIFKDDNIVATLKMTIWHFHAIIVI